jgi:hypothetical protein
MRAHTSTRRIHSRRANLKRVTAMHEIAAKRQEVIFWIAFILLRKY